MPATQSTGLASIGTDAQRSKPSNEYALDRKALLTLEATEAGTVAARILDQVDADLVRERLAAMDYARSVPRSGDFVDFADGVQRRISHCYYIADGWETNTFQTSDGGRWYLSRLGCEFSGALYPSIDGETFTDTGETRLGSAWVFHHDHHCAGGGVDFLAPFRVFACSMAAQS